MDCPQGIEVMSFSDPMFWFTSIGLPAIIIVAYVIVLLHERSLNRKDRSPARRARRPSPRGAC
jgi:hypothetical protein